MDIQVPNILFSQEAEESLAGAAIVDPGVLDRVDVQPEAFYIQRHGFIWEACQKLHLAGRSIDFVTVTEILERQGKLAELGGPAFLTQLIGNTYSTMNAEEYANIVNDYARRRAWVLLANRMAKTAHDLDQKLENDAGDIVDSLLNSVTTTGAARHISKYTGDVLDETIERMANPKEIWGIRTGFYEFDSATGGIQTNEILYISGDPGVGKSKLIMQMAYQMALNDTPGVIYSLEMPGSQVIRRLISYLAKVQARKMKSGAIDQVQLEEIAKEIDAMNKLPLYMSDSVHWTTTGIRADMARMKNKYGARWFVLDYAYLLRDGEGMSENDRTGLISSRLKGICRSLGVAGLVIHSLRKTGPGLVKGQDLRGSNQQFYDTDLLLFMAEDPGDKNLTLCYFGKGRELDNPKKSFRLGNIPGYPAFGNLEPNAQKL